MRLKRSSDNGQYLLTHLLTYLLIYLLTYFVVQDILFKS
jgi:uncharacterized membrane protein